MAKAVWIESLGCPKNEVDGEHLMIHLMEKGYEIIDDKDQADILILNTCGFIQSAKEESIEELFKLIALKNQNSSKRIIVCGCLPQRYPRELWSQLPEVDAIVGVTEFAAMHSICSSVLEGRRIFRIREPGGRDGVKRMKRKVEGLPFAYIKIADGCDNRCSYCAIGLIRGGFRSKRLTDVLKEARQLAEMGVREINLVAQDTTLYGIDLYGEKRLARLLSNLSKIEKLKWIRLLYAHPAHFTDQLIDQIAASPKVCKYVDLPLQHISDEILERMNRKVTRKAVEQLISKLRDKIPKLTLRTSFIVGFPGERKKHFRELLNFVEQVKFDKLGAFVYSKEEGTRAYSFKGQASLSTKQKRMDQLMLAQQRIVSEKHEKKIGETLNVLIERRSEEYNDCWVGRSEGEAPEVDGVILVKGDGLKPGQFVQAEVVDHRDYDLLAQTPVSKSRINRRLLGESRRDACVGSAVSGSTQAARPRPSKGRAKQAWEHGHG